MRKIILALLAVALLSTETFGQSVVNGNVIVNASQQRPTVPSTQAGMTVATTGAFQQALAANANRSACLIQNTSPHTAYVYWLPTGAPSAANSLQVSAGGIFICANGAGGVIQSQIQWAGTAADPFVVSENQ